MSDSIELTGKGNINRGLIFVIIFVIVTSILYLFLFGNPSLMIMGLPVVCILSILSFLNIKRALKKKKFMVIENRIEYYENDEKTLTIPIKEINYIETWRSLIDNATTHPNEINVMKINYSHGGSLRIDNDTLEIFKLNRLYEVLTDLSNNGAIFEIRDMGY